AFSVITVRPTTTSDTVRRAGCAAIVHTALNATIRRFMAIDFTLYSDGVPLHIVTHPLVHDALVNLRDKRTSPDDFRRSATRISVMLAAEALKEVPTIDVVVESPLGPARGRRVKPDVVVVPVLRAGLGMLDAVL